MGLTARGFRVHHSFIAPSTLSARCKDASNNLLIFNRADDGSWRCGHEQPFEYTYTHRCIDSHLFTPVSIIVEYLLAVVDDKVP